MTLSNVVNLNYKFTLGLYSSAGLLLDLSPHFVSGSMDWNENASLTCSFELQDDEDLTIAPKNCITLYPDIMDIDKWTPKRWLKLKIDYTNESWISGKLLIMTHNYDEKTGRLSLTTEDISKNLFVPNQNMDVFENKRLSEITTDILKKFGITDYEINYPRDFIISQFDFANSTPIDRLRELFFVGLVTWYMDGDKFIVLPEANQKGGIWSFSNRANILDLKTRRNLDGYYNEVTVGRTVKASNVCFVEGQEFGFQIHNLCAPLLYARPAVEIASNGTIEMITLLDDDWGYDPFDWEPGVSPYPVDPRWHLGLSGAATQISFIFKQTINTVGTGGGQFRIRVYGINPENLNSYGASETFHHTEKEEDDQRLYGVWKYPNVIDNPYIPDMDQAELIAKWILKKAKKNLLSIDLRTVLNMKIKPTQSCKIETWRTDLDDFYYIDGLRHEFSTNKISTSLKCSFYQGDKLNPARKD